jgi:hypothetical protein
VTQVSNDYIYKGEQITHRISNREGNGVDWALVQPARNLVEQGVARSIRKANRRVQR